MSQVLFRDFATAPFHRKMLSLFPGLGYAAGYKVSQRIYKFGGQPFFGDLITSRYKDSFTNTFGERKGKLMIQATAGRCVAQRLNCSVLPSPLALDLESSCAAINLQSDRHRRGCAAATGRTQDQASS